LHPWRLHHDGSPSDQSGRGARAGQLRLRGTSAGRHVVSLERRLRPRHPGHGEEDQAVEQDLRSEIFPPGAQDETEESKAAKERPMGEDEGEVEQKELKEDGLEGD
jgi:hypothetical protein